MYMYRHGNDEKSSKEFFEYALRAYTQRTIVVRIIIHGQHQDNLNNVESQKEGFTIQVRSSVRIMYS